MSRLHSGSVAASCGFIAELLSVVVLIGCSATTNKVTERRDPSASSSGDSAGSAATSSGGAASGGAGNGLILDVDAATPASDAGDGCAHLNIAIFGNPGANNSSNFEQWLAKSGTSVTRIQTTANEPVTQVTLQPFDVVILDFLARDYTADEATIFSAWASAGGGVAALSGYQDNTTLDWRANSLLAPLGVAYSGGLRWGPVTNFASHPVTLGLTSVTFTGGYAISDLGGTASTRTPIAFLPATPEATAGVAVQLGAGHAFIWGDEWIEFDSEWSAQPEIPQLWVQVFGWISPQTKCALDPPK